MKDYDYLVSMAILKLSMEEKDKLLANSESKKEELRILQTKSWSDLWEADLEVFLEALGKQVEFWLFNQTKTIFIGKERKRRP